MMKLLNTIALTAAVLISVGCAPKKPLAYDIEHSKALNIAKAAGIDYGLKDVEVPKDTVSDIRHSTGYGLAYGLASYNSPLPGVSSLSSAGLSVLAWALQPKSPSSRNSIIAWMPENIGGNSKEEASKKLTDLIISATKKAANDLNYETNVLVGKKAITLPLTDNKSENCKVSTIPNSTISTCYIAYGIRYPYKTDNISDFIGKEPAWFFDPTESDFSRMAFKSAIRKYKNLFEFNQLDLLIATSKYLPEWVYFYLAPNEIKITKDNNLKVPMILNQGKALYFITEKDT